MNLPEVTVDTDACTDCRAIIVALQNAYISLTAGKTRIKVRFQERWTEYNPANAAKLRDLIQTVWAQCPDTAGLIDFNPAKRARRGAPAFLRIT